MTIIPEAHRRRADSEDAVLGIGPLLARSTANQAFRGSGNARGEA